jgi:arabinan endo-1,5-alpha-L-arabinosidase
LLALLVGCAPMSQNGGAGVRSYINPVLDRDFPDPAVLRAEDGWFYAYATQGRAGERMLNIQVARSRDLVAWEHLGDALPGKPPWAARKQNFWAPHVLYDRDQRRYFMYYSAEPDDGPGKCLAVATGPAPAGPFVDSGRPMRCGEKFEHIDPMAFDDPHSGRRLLYWGSAFKPIRAQELAPDRLHFLSGSAPVELVLPGPDETWASLVEAAWLTYREGTYYLFYSAGLCCGANADYSLRVARSPSPLGPFESLALNGKAQPILSPNGFWLAPGHNSVVRDGAGDDWLVYHAMDAQRAYAEDPMAPWTSRRVMLLDRIEYRDGWPRLPGAPSAGQRSAPIFPREAQQ